MSDGRSTQLKAPRRRSVRWTSFVASPPQGRVSRGLQEEGVPAHRARVEHNADTLLVHVSDEAGGVWTTLAIDRATRHWAVAQRPTQRDAAASAYGLLYAGDPEAPA